MNSSELFHIYTIISVFNVISTAKVADTVVTEPSPLKPRRGRKAAASPAKKAAPKEGEKCVIECSHN